MKKQIYLLEALERDMILFKWKSETMKLPRFPEWYLTETGALGYDLVHNKWVHGTFTGLCDEFGDFTEFVAMTLNSEPETYTLRNHEQVVVCGNTPLYRPFKEERDFYATMKEETDRSILCQLINTRLNKALVAASDQQKKQIQKAYKEVIEGYPMILVTELLEDLDSIDLTNPQDIDKMQYLSAFYSTMEKREANNFGIDLENVEKRAQINDTELKQYDDVTTLKYLIMYEMRQAFVDEMKEHGFELEIVRNPIFYDEPKKEDVEEGTFEIAEEQDEEPTDQEPEEENKEEENNEQNEN